MDEWQLCWTSERSILVKAPEFAAHYAASSLFAAWVHSHCSDMIRSVIPSATGVLIEFNIQQCTINDSWSTVVRLVESYDREYNTTQSSDALGAREILIPVCYDEYFAPDLNLIAHHLNCHPERIIELHTSVQYHVETMGFMPGFGYLSSLHDSLRLPRKGTPRTQVPAGSVGIAENMTAVYPHQSAGGWHLIGRTPIQLFDPNQNQPALLRVGDSVRFEQITHDEFNSITQSHQWWED
ncbi:MAG: 5-oxoprolinase subunit PxpB [Phycisphaerales bacterium]|nr:5-oxoprolinase subunit PxpB [Phycisphaerales bacterium]